MFVLLNQIRNDEKVQKIMCALHNGKPQNKGEEKGKKKYRTQGPQVILIYMIFLRKRPVPTKRSGHKKSSRSRGEKNEDVRICKGFRR
jgi:hypothetical protein